MAEIIIHILAFICLGASVVHIFTGRIDKAIYCSILALFILVNHISLTAISLEG